MGIEPGTFRLRSRRAIEHLKVDRVLPEFAVEIYLYHVVDVEK